MYNCVIFDVDGTMINTDEAVFESYQRVIFEEFGRYYEEDELKKAYSVPTLEALKRLGFEDVEMANKKYHEYLMDAFTRVKPYEGIIEVLEYLIEKGYLMGVVTSRNKDEVDNDVCLQSLLKYFKHVICSNDTKNHKPHPEPILKVMELLRADPKTTLYIGDTYFDYKSAKDSGADFALAGWGAKSIKDIEADYDLKSPEEILDIIKK